MTVTLTIFTDFICPWCYLSTRRTERIAREYDVTRAYVHFPLHPSLPEEGTTLQRLFAGRGLAVTTMQAQMAARMEQEGLPFVARETVCNTRRAQELSAWALSQGVSLVDALYRANFVEGADLHDPDTLIALAARAGIDRDDAREAIETRGGRAQIDREWALARELGVTGVPTFVAEGRAVVGAQPYEQLARLVEAAGAKRRE
jgi:predicted DsbA family dithiol-disulfide isomerase